MRSGLNRRGRAQACSTPVLRKNYRSDLERAKLTNLKEDAENKDIRP